MQMDQINILLYTSNVLEKVGKHSCYPLRSKDFEVCVLYLSKC